MVWEKPRSRREAGASPMQWLKRFCDNICRFRMGPKWVSVLLLMDGSFLPFFSKRVLSPFSPTPIRVTERPLLKHQNFSVIIGGASVNMAKGETKCTQFCGNSVDDAPASLRANDRGFWSGFRETKIRAFSFSLKKPKCFKSFQSETMFRLVTAG